MDFLKISQLATLNFDVRYSYSGRWTHSATYKTDVSQYGRRGDMLCLILSGSRTYVTERGTVTFPQGSVLFIPNGTKYVSWTTPTKETDNAVFIGTVFRITDEMGEPLQLEHGIYGEWNNLAKLTTLMEALDRTVLEHPFYIIKTKILLLRLLSAMIFQKQEDRLSGQAIKPAMTFIAKHYRENLPIKRYADECHMSESYFRKKFVENVGKSPLEYRNELRFSKARQMYTEGYDLQEIATSVGFCDIRSLTKAYKKRYGVSLKDERNIETT